MQMAWGSIYSLDKQVDLYATERVSGDLPHPGIEPRSPTLQEDALPSEPPGKLKRLGYAIPNVEIFHLWDMENFQ